MSTLARERFANGRGRAAKLSACAAMSALSWRGRGEEGQHGAAYLGAMRLLNDRDPLVRQKAVEALFQLGGREATGAIEGALSDTDAQVRQAAAEMLGTMRSMTSRRVLFDALMDRDTKVRCAAAVALSRLGDRSGLPMVVKMVEREGPDQMFALRCLGQILGQRFGANKAGLAAAKRWIKMSRKRALR